MQAPNSALQRVLRWAAPIWAATLANCTLLSDFDIHECESHADCAAAPGEVLRCDEGLCVPGCVDNASCAAQDARFPLCTKPRGQCVGLLTAQGECYAAAGYDEIAMRSLTAQDVVFMGSFAPTLRSSSWLTLSMGVDEINAGGGIRAGETTSPLGVVSCLDSAQTIDEALQHLVQELGATALVASLEDVALRAALELPATRARALYLSPNGANSGSSSSGNDDPLLWYLGASYAEVLPLYPELVGRAAAAFERAGGAPAAFRVAILESDAAEDRELAAAVVNGLRVVTDVEQVRREGRLRNFDALSVQRDPSELLAYSPALLLVFAGGLVSVSPYPERTGLISLLEGAEPTTPSFQPFYVFGPRNPLDASLAALAASSESFRRRAVGVTAERRVEPERARALSGRFRSTFPELPPELGLNVSFAAYDALHYLASAIAVAGPSLPPFTASELAANLARVTDPNGAPLDLMTPFAERSSFLSGARESTFNVSGTSGPAEFDAQRTRPAPPRVYCWGSDGAVLDLSPYEPGLTLSPVRFDCAEDLMGPEQAEP
jgi:hypothetical protein